MLCPPLTTPKIVIDWIERHRHPASFALHVLGIPPTLLGALTLPVPLFTFSGRVLLFSLGMFAGGYGLQILGHLIEGSVPGEITALRAWVKRRGSAAASALQPNSDAGVRVEHAG